MLAMTRLDKCHRGQPLFYRADYLRQPLAIARKMKRMDEKKHGLLSAGQLLFRHCDLLPVSG
jgi:hypothetical protein